MAPIWLFACNLALFFLAHSLLASLKLKDAMAAHFPRWAPWYRIGYNALFALWSLALIGQYLRLPRAELLYLPPALRLAGLLPVFLGLWVMRAAFRRYDWGEFIGTSYLRARRHALHTRLQLTGWNRCVRHPLYLGTLLLIWGLVWLSPNDALLTFALLTSLYLPLGIWSEERKLVAEFGDAYRTYRKETPALLPRWRCLRSLLLPHEPRTH